MTTISLRVNDDESKLIHDYVSINQLNMSQFIRDAVLDKIENDLDLDEDRILYAFEKAKQENRLNINIQTIVETLSFKLIL